MSIKTALIGPTRVPAISLGTWSWGDKTWGYKPEDLPQVREAWFACLEAGYPFFDTAEVSGLCDDMESSGGTDKSNNGWTGPSHSLGLR
jgi:diketogulonate reductase-like aldo/keto reductase